MMHRLDQLTIEYINTKDLECLLDMIEEARNVYRQTTDRKEKIVQRMKIRLLERTVISLI